MHVCVWRSRGDLPFEGPTLSASVTAASGSTHLCTRAGLGILPTLGSTFSSLNEAKTLIP